MPQNLRATDIPFRFTDAGYPAPALNNRVLFNMIRTILLTRPGERVMRPTYGNNAHLLLFGNIDQAIASRVEFEIKRAIAEWEPRVDVLGVELSLDKSNAKVTAHLSWRGSDDQVQVSSIVLGGLASGN